MGLNEVWVWDERVELRRMVVPLPCGSAMRLSYVWRHVQTGEGGRTSALFTNRKAFADCLSRWNASQPGVWEYRAED